MLKKAPPFDSIDIVRPQALKRSLKELVLKKYKGYLLDNRDELSADYKLKLKETAEASMRSAQDQFPKNKLPHGFPMALRLQTWVTDHITKCFLDVMKEESNHTVCMGDATRIFISCDTYFIGWMPHHRFEISLYRREPYGFDMMRAGCTVEWNRLEKANIIANPWSVFDIIGEAAEPSSMVAVKTS